MKDSQFQFGTVGSPMSTPPKPGGSVGAILRLVEMGLGCLELGWVRAVRVSEEMCALIRNTAAENAVGISVHAPYFINLNADDIEWPKSRQRLMDAAHYGNMAGASDVVFHPGSYFGHPANEVLPIAIERLGGCLDELRGNGNPVILRPETMGKSAMLGSLEDTLEMSRVLVGIEPCLDFAHLHARAGDGSINTYDDWVKIIDAYRKALGKEALQRLHIHLSGIEYTAKGERKHLPIEEADLDTAAIFKALKDKGCGGRILCESPILEEDALLLQKKWKDISGEK
jgi:deoxyribonuclease-4